jgi:hypothetical protein
VLGLVLSTRWLQTDAPSLDSSALAEGSIVQEERRRQILHAAVRAFARKGYHASRVSDIATEALMGWAFGQLPDSDDDVAAAERAVVEIVVGGLATGHTAALA